MRGASVFFGIPQLAPRALGEGRWLMKTGSMVLVVMMALAGRAGASGPFGVEMAEFSPERYGCTLRRGSFYECTGFPALHPDIDRYLVQYHAALGICFLKGISKEIATPRFGDAIRRAVDEVYDQLQPKYGQAQRADLLVPGSIWSAPGDWMQGLLARERSYHYVADLHPAIEGVTAYGVFAMAMSPDTAFWTVEFYTRQSDACDRLDNKAKGSVF